MRIFISVILLLYIHLSFAQKHDNLWLFGYESYTNTEGWGGTNIEFGFSPPAIFQEYRDMNFSETNASICDKDGFLLFYTNGIYIANRQNQLMQNGEGLNPGPFANNNSIYGYILDQGAIILPQPESENIYYLFHQDRVYPTEDLDWHTSHFYYSKIDVSQNQGMGKVLDKNHVIIRDTLDLGKITATKHANGRDWWIIDNEFETNKYYRFLLTPNGVSNVESQSIGIDVPKGIGQAIFSPDGTKYVRITVDDITMGYLNIYDFERCTGLLSNHIQLVLTEQSIFPGIAISPSSQFLYVCASRNLYQYDLWAEDIPASKDTVAIYDGFEEWTIPTMFFMAQLAPNDKIYINSFSSTRYLHVIHEPDLPGEACNVEQHGIQLPTYNKGSMPNFPNYRLGALEGSPCDTIVSSVEVVKAEQEVKIYPNPAQDYIDVTLSEAFDENVTIQIIDMYGRIIEEYVLLAYTNTMSLPVHTFPNGVYWLRFNLARQGILADKIIINK